MTHLSAAQREAVVQEALSWIGTPYHHMGRVKGGGVDCAMFPLEVYARCGIIDGNMPVPLYPLDWSRHQSEERFLNVVLGLADEITEAEALPGDLILVHQGRTYSHGAIIVDLPRLVHSQFRVGVVGGDITSGRFVRQAKKFFTVRVPDGVR